MRCTIVHSIPGRMRLRLPHALDEHEAVALEELLMEMPCVSKATAYPAAGCVAVAFDDTPEAREAVIRRMASLSFHELAEWDAPDSLVLAPRARHLFASLANAVAWFLLRSLLPNPLRTLWWLWSAIPFWKAGLRELGAGHLNVPVLDAAAVAMGFTQGANNAGETMLLLRTGEILEDYTQKRAGTSLVRSFLEIPTTAWVCRGSEEVEVALEELKAQDSIVVRTGGAIPVDGTVVSGQAMVNQASLTGESAPVLREAGDSVYAGTAVEEGEIHLCIAGDPEVSKIRSIIAMVEDSEADKSADQRRIESIADKLVPWNFALAAAVAFITRSLTKTAAVLMVDYSCALKTSGAIAVMAAQREGATHGFMVKGSRYFSAIEKADAIVFDKTGTLTNACPEVHRVEAYNGYTRDDVLRLAACLEEHFPHPVAHAVVKAALEEGLEHREHHAAVEYIVAHGIVSSLHGKRTVIGSQHFVLEDEQVPVSAELLSRIGSQALGTSPLFLAVDGELKGVLYIDDPLRDEAAAAIAALKDEGFKRIIMLTGDAHRTAERIASEAGIEEFHADLLPEDKLELVRQLQAEGYRVCMVGDGVNDSPALAAADISIAMSAGSAVAREAADIALTSNDLKSIVRLRQLARALDRRMRNGYRFTLLFNTFLMSLGVGGVLMPQQAGFFHNGSTVALSAFNARAYRLGDSDASDT